MMKHFWLVTILFMSAEFQVFANPQQQFIDQALVWETLADSSALIYVYESTCDNFNDLLYDEMGIKLTQMEAKSVSVVVIQGTLIHIADYKDKTRIATCLDGESMGLQAIAVAGIKTHESIKVRWHKDYFTHKYAHAKVISYPTKQTIEFYVN